MRGLGLSISYDAFLIKEYAQTAKKDQFDEEKRHVTNAYLISYQLIPDS